MKLFVGFSLLLVAISAGPTPQYQAGDEPDTADSQTKQWVNY